MSNGRNCPSVHALCFNLIAFFLFFSLFKFLQIWAWERLDISRPERLVYKGRKSIISDTKAEKERSSIAGDAIVDNEQLPADPLGCRYVIGSLLP